MTSVDAPKVSLLRLDHRTVRDQRITSHVALTARALGAQYFYYTGERDTNMEQSVSDVSTRWGGSYTISHLQSFRPFIRDFDGIKVHLSMYGERHTETLTTLRQVDTDQFMLIVGGPKVPPYIYEMVDFNTAIGWQPHSEVAATAIFLHELLGDTPLYHRYVGADMGLDGTGYKAQRSERYRS